MRKKLLILGGLAILGLSSLTCSPAFVLRAGYEQAKLLNRRQPIDRMLEDPAIDAELRERLTMVVQARNFAADVLGLDAGDSYTTFAEVERDTLLLVLSGARQDRFEPVTWWFPIVGRVSYKGFFNHDAARREAARLESRGYDTFLRPANAFSTLGWFNDPMMSTLLRYDEVTMVSIVIHELAHNTMYLPGQVTFNESFASFVGDRGAIAYFCAIEGDDGPACRRAVDNWHDTRLFGRYLSGLTDELHSLYDEPDLTLDERLARREAIFEDARDRFEREVSPAFRTSAFRGFARLPMNNATIMARRSYYRDLDLFESVYERHGGELREVIDAIVAAAEAESRDPFAALGRMADGVD